MLTARIFALLLAMTTLPSLAGELPFAQPRPQLYTAGQPTTAQLTAAAQAGVRTVIDLRQADEDRGFDEATQAAALGLRYVSLPVSGSNGVTVDNARALQAALAAAAADGPVLLHCASGNRVGALLSVMNAKLEGADTEAAIELGRRAGMTRLEPAARAALHADTP